MDTNTIIGFLTLLTAVGGTFLKTQTDVAKLKTEMQARAAREQDVAKLIQDLTGTIHRIEKALVKAGLIEID